MLSNEEISVKFNKYKPLIKNQLLNTLTGIMRKNEISFDELYTCNIQQANIISDDFIGLNISVNSFDNNKNISHKLFIVFMDKYQELTKLTKDNVKHIMQSLIDITLCDYNIEEKNIDNYILISNNIPKINEEKNINKQFVDNIKKFIDYILTNKILDNENYNLLDPHNTYNVRLFNPELQLGQFPLDTTSKITITAQILTEVIPDNIKKYNSDFNFCSYDKLDWLYQKFNIDLTSKHWQKLYTTLLENIIETDKVYTNHWLKIKLLDFNNLNYYQQFILLHKGQDPVHINRLNNILNSNIRFNIITNYSFDKKNNVIKLTLQGNTNNATIFFGENGIISQDNQIIYKPGNKINGTLDKAKLYLKNNILDMNIHTTDYFTNINTINDFKEIINNEANLLIDAYNGKRTIKSMQTISELNAKLAAKLNGDS